LFADGYARLMLADTSSDTAEYGRTQLNGARIHHAHRWSAARIALGSVLYKAFPLKRSRKTFKLLGPPGFEAPNDNVRLRRTLATEVASVPKVDRGCSRELCFSGRAPVATARMGQDKSDGVEQVRLVEDCGSLAKLLRTGSAEISSGYLSKDWVATLLVYLNKRSLELTYHRLMRRTKAFFQRGMLKISQFRRACAGFRPLASVLPRREAPKVGIP